ncbi:MAG: hypothetical protein WCV67_17695 [Victivallaceae bacterium]|jgi:hypothetical protein
MFSANKANPELKNRGFGAILWVMWENINFFGNPIKHNGNTVINNFAFCSFFQHFDILLLLPEQ